MVRNLLDQDFEPYAALVMALELEEVFQSLYHIGGLRAPSLTVDGVPVLLLEEDGEGAATPSKAVVYRGEADGHTLELSAFVAAGTPWSNAPMLRWAIVAVALLVVPLLAVIVWLFRRHVSRPIDTMIAAAAHVQAGERGYQIAGDAPSREFALLYNHFNAMSAELESQFDRSYQEQQALQQAKIKALQSQINPPLPQQHPGDYQLGGETGG